MSDYSKRIADLPSDKRALLEIKIRQKQRAAASAGTATRARKQGPPRLTGSDLDRHLDYWKKQADSLSSSATLITDRPRLTGQRYLAKRLGFEISPELCSSLKVLGDAYNSPLFITLLAGFTALLARYTSRQAVLIATRAALGSESTPASRPLVNTLLLGASVPDHLTFADLVGQVREVVEGALAHKRLPFEQLIESLQQSNPAGRVNPAATFLFRNSDGFHKDWNDNHQHDHLSDITLTITGDGSELSGEIEYDANLFDEATVAGLAERYVILLDAASNNPDRRVCDLPLITPNEHQKLIHDVITPASGDRDPETMIELFSDKVLNSADSIAITAGSLRLSYSELGRRSSGFAFRLKTAGVRAGDLVVILLAPSIEAIVAALGVLESGGAFLFIDPAATEERVRNIVNAAGSRLIVTGKRFGASAARLGLKTVLVDEETPDKDQARIPSERLDPDSLACATIISPDSDPRCLAFTHRALIDFFAALDELSARGGATEAAECPEALLVMLWNLVKGVAVALSNKQPERTFSNDFLSGFRRGRPMQFSLFYFSSDESAAGDKYRLVIEGAKFADRSGFSAIWVPERHFHPFGALYPNPSTLASALAMITERIQLRAGSVVLPLHHPVRVAEEWSLVDNLSNGRAGVAFASGWHSNDFVFAPGNYDNRRDITMKGVEMVRRLWRGESVPVEGGSGEQINIKIFPTPVQPELPVWITAAGTLETYAIAGRLGAGVLTNLLGQSLEGLSKKLDVYREAAPEGGGRGHVTLMLHTFLGESVNAVKEKVRTPFSNYLKTFSGLLDNLARGLKLQVNRESLTAEDEEAMVSYAFDRYFNTSALFGTPASCLEMIDKLYEIGVDEVACLIDFGVDHGSALEGLHYLDELRRRCESHSERSLSMQASARRGVAIEYPAKEFLISGLAPFQHSAGPTETAAKIGRLKTRLAATSLCVLDRNANLAPPGLQGYLHVAGPGLAHCFLDDPALTADRLIPNQYGKPGDRWLKTSMKARYVSGGDIKLL
jgi:natural product biosynthesis luciferase-like monooxygenase protein